MSIPVYLNLSDPRHSVFGGAVCGPALPPAVRQEEPEHGVLRHPLRDRQHARVRIGVGPSDGKHENGIRKTGPLNIF